MKPTYLLRLEFENRAPLMLRSWKDNYTDARDGAELIKQTTNATRVEIWNTTSYNLVAVIEDKK